MEAIVLLLATAQPWAFGGVDAWAELAFGVAVVVAAILSTFHDEAKGRAYPAGRVWHWRDSSCSVGASQRFP